MLDEPIRIYVPTTPVPQPRAKATTAGTGRARMYEAKAGHQIHAFKASVRHEAQAAYSGPPLEGPLRVDVKFIFPRPNSLRWKSKAMPRRPHVSGRGDIDNCLKAVLDALNATLFVDDRIVCQSFVEKWIAAGNEQPHVEIVIHEVYENASLPVFGCPNFGFVD